MKELVAHIVKSLVDYPDQVQVTESKSRDGILVELRVAGEDMGRVIGKGGRVINAIRALAQVRAEIRGQQVSVEVLED